MIILSILLLSALSGVLYRLGGSSPEAKLREFKWLPQFIKYMPKPRDVGCNLCVLVALFIIGIRAPWWKWLLTFGVQWAALSTYYDWVPFNKGEDNHWMHGFGIGLATFLLLPIIPTLARAMITALVGGWASLNWNLFGCDEEAQSDEVGRGVLIVLSTLILLAVL